MKGAIAWGLAIILGYVVYFFTRNTSPLPTAFDIIMLEGRRGWMNPLITRGYVLTPNASVNVINWNTTAMLPQLKIGPQSKIFPTHLGKVYAGYEVVKNLSRINPERVVFMMDTDILWGGCDADPVQLFHQITSQANSSILLGTELTCVAIGNVTEDELCPFFHNTPPHMNPILRNWRGCVKDEVVAYRCPMEYIYPNSGLIAGKAKDLASMYSDLVKLANTGICYNDQTCWLMLMKAFPGRITLDYNAELVLNMFGIPKESTHVTFSGKLYSTWTNSTLCFAHGNGQVYHNWKALKKKQKDVSTMRFVFVWTAVGGVVGLYVGVAAFYLCVSTFLPEYWIRLVLLVRRVTAPNARL